MQTPSNSPKQKQYDPDANVYIAGLPRNYNKDKLYKLFSAYGPVLRYKFVSPKDDTKCPYGFVQFSHTICAQQAIKALNGHTISKNKESIEVSIAAVGRRALFKSEEPTNLYIENMPSSWNNDILSSIFGKYGNIIQSKITGNNVAFVRFETHEQALNAINHLHREETELNKRLTVRFATCQHKKSNNNNNGHVQLQENNSNLNYNMQFQQCHNNMNSNNNNNNNNNNLYIKNLPPTYNQLDLERLFSSFGSISSATIINDSIGVAFVRYKDAENAKRAVKELNGTKPELFEKEIVVKYAHSDIDKEKNIQSINNMQYIHNFNDFMLTNTNKHANTNKNKNEYIVCGYIRNHQRLFCTRFNILNISEIINKYFGGEDNENDIDNDSCFDDLLSRINTFDNILEIMQNNIYGINNKINNLLYESEQKRMYKMNFMQKRFTDIIANLYHKMNNQLQNMANVLQENVEKENVRIKSLEKQIRHILDLNMFRDRDMSKIQNKINNSYRFESDKVRIWLKDIVHLEQYYNVFISNGYDDMESIADITDNDLIHIGIDKIGHKKKLIKYAKKLGFQGCFKQFEMNGLNINYIRYDSPSITNTFDSV